MDQEISEDHANLIERVKEMDKGQRVKKSERNEPSLRVSEFYLVKSGLTDGNIIQIRDLVKPLGEKGHHAELNKNLCSKKKKSQVLGIPLEKLSGERMRRKVKYEKTNKELLVWNAPVAHIRTAECVSFPLIQPSMRLEPTEDFLEKFRIQSDLEKELAALEPVKENKDKDKDQSELTLKEILEMRAEKSRSRAQESYKVAKAHRQNKIKSKKFYQIQRKKKMKLQLKEFEELKKIDPEAAIEKSKHLDNIRARERMTLRHKSTGHWARNKLIRAKYDKECRQELAQQISLGRELTQELQTAEDSDEGFEDESSAPITGTSKEENPWLNNSVKVDSEIDQFLSQYRKYQSSNDQYERTLSGKFKISDLQVDSSTAKLSTSGGCKKARIDPNAFKEVKTKYLKTQLPNANAAESEALDDDEETDAHQLMEEAFSDEDVVEDFKKEKDEEIKKKEPEDENLSLPGWGRWGGSSREKRRLISKFANKTPHKDGNKGNVLITEQNDPAIRKHQVSELPFPFTSVKDYEVSMRAPIGRNFVPEKTHRRLITPAVKTKMGKIIEPMNENSLISSKNLKH